MRVLGAPDSIVAEPAPQLADRRPGVGQAPEQESQEHLVLFLRGIARVEPLLEAATQLLAGGEPRVAGPAWLELERAHLLGALAVRASVALRLVERPQPGLLPSPTKEAHRLVVSDPPGEDVFPYMRKTPNVVSGTGAFDAAESPSASTRRVSSGSMTPSSQRRAVE